MLQWKRNTSAFTLIELLIVVIIVAVLAGVGVPILSANVLRAKTTEADAGLGTVRTGLRAFFAENQTYLGATLALAGVGATDLTGRYFENDDFSLPTLQAAAYCIAVTGDAAGAAPFGSQVVGVNRSMNQDGTIFNSNNCA